MRVTSGHVTRDRRKAARAVVVSLGRHGNLIAWAKERGLCLRVLGLVEEFLRDDPYGSPNAPPQPPSRWLHAVAGDLAAAA